MAWGNNVIWLYQFTRCNCSWVVEGGFHSSKRNTHRSTWNPWHECGKFDGCSHEASSTDCSPRRSSPNSNVTRWRPEDPGGFVAGVTYIDRGFSSGQTSHRLIGLCVRRLQIGARCIQSSSSSIFSSQDGLRVTAASTGIPLQETLQLCTRGWHSRIWKLIQQLSCRELQSWRSKAPRQPAHRRSLWNWWTKYKRAQPSFQRRCQRSAGSRRGISLCRGSRIPRKGWLVDLAMEKDTILFEV